MGKFKSHTLSYDYIYNNVGDLKQDGNKGITYIDYDYLGHPVRVQFSDGSCTEYVYAADGRKLREKHTTAVEGLHMNMGQTLNLLPSQIHRFVAARSRK
jgi:hypothetical protein